MVKAAVDVYPNELVGPLDAVRVEALVVRIATQAPPAECLRDTVEPGEWPPIERAADDVTTSVNNNNSSNADAAGKDKRYVLGRIVGAVSTGFHEVDFT